MTITPDTKLRSHKINILRSMSKYLILLLIPLVHTLIDQRNDLPSVLEGQFFDWLLVGLILAVGVYAWVVFFFFIDEDGITVQQGILLRRKSFFPFARVTAISVEHPWYFRPFRIAYLTVDTNGGDAKRTDFAIWIHARRAEAVLRHYHEITGGSGGEQNRKKKPKALGMQRKHIVFFSLITSSSLTGVLYVYAILKQSANYLGEEYPQRVVDRFADLAKLGSFNAPPLVAFVAYALLLCWAVSFVFTLLRYLRFRIQRELKQLDIRIGLLSPRKISIMVEKINFVFLRQSLLSRLLGIASVFLHCAGYGKDQKDFSVLIPAGGKDSLHEQLESILPEFSLAPRSIRPRINDLTRFLTVPLVLFGGVVLGSFFAFRRLENFDTVIWIGLLVLGIPALGFLLIKIYAFFFSGIGVDDHAVTLYYTKGFQIITSMIPLHKITAMEISQAFYHHTTGACHLSVYTMAEKTQKQTVINMNRDRVEELLMPHLMPYLRIEQLPAEEPFDQVPA